MVATSQSQAHLDSIILAALRSPSIHNYSQIAEHPKVKSLPETGISRRLLCIFSFGTIEDLRSSGITVSEELVAKLQKLTILTVAAKNSVIPYLQLDMLHLSNRELEDMVIDMIYADMIVAKIDSNNREIHVQSAISRDLLPSDFDRMVLVLGDWLETVQNTIREVDSLVGGVSKINSEVIDPK